MTVADDLRAAAHFLRLHGPRISVASSTDELADRLDALSAARQQEPGIKGLAGVLTLLDERYAHYVANSRKYDGSHDSLLRERFKGLAVATHEAITAIRSALAPSVVAEEPVAWVAPETLRDLQTGAPWAAGAIGELSQRRKDNYTAPLYASPQPPIAEGMVRETGWLIELKGSTPSWFQLVDGDNWTGDSLKALRFGRKQDAEAYIADIGWTEAFASEHEWADPSPKYLVRRAANQPEPRAGG